MESLSSVCKELIEEIKGYEKKQFQRWESEINNLLKNKRDNLELTGRLMDIDSKSGLLSVHFSERLITLLKDVRQLQELEFPLSKEIV